MVIVVGITGSGIRDIQLQAKYICSGVSGYKLFKHAVSVKEVVKLVEVASDGRIGEVSGVSDRSRLRASQWESVVMGFLYMQLVMEEVVKLVEVE